MVPLLPGALVAAAILLLPSVVEGAAVHGEGVAAAAAFEETT